MQDSIPIQREFGPLRRVGGRLRVVSLGPRLLQRCGEGQRAETFSVDLIQDFIIGPKEFSLGNDALNGVSGLEKMEVA